MINGETKSSDAAELRPGSGGCSVVTHPAGDMSVIPQRRLVNPGDFFLFNATNMTDFRQTLTKLNSSAHTLRGLEAKG